MRLEPLEERMLLAVGPQLIGVQPNEGDLLNNGDIRHVAPRDLTFRFDEVQAIDATTLDGIRITRSGLDGAFGDANDVVIQPGFIGVDSTHQNEVVARFAETLPDDLYRIDIFGSGTTPLRNVKGEPFNDGTDVQLDFELDLGAQIVAVVPQPVTRQPDGSLSQDRDQIIVYFNDDDLHDTPVSSTAPDAPSVVNPEFYQLIFTNDTVSNTDDVRHNPTRVDYDPRTDIAVLTFAGDLEDLSGAGSYRLRIGTAESVPLPPVSGPAGSDPGSSFETASDLGTLGAQSRIVSEEIVSQNFPLEFPGATDEPGHRDISAAESHLLGLPDDHPGITTFAYNFRDDYGRDPVVGNVLHNVITETQKNRAREVFELYGSYLGVQFYETANQGLTVATGDLRAITDTSQVSAPGGVTALYGPSSPAEGVEIDAVVLDNAEAWNDAAGGDWFQTAMRHIGRFLGMGDTNDLPPLNVAGNDASLAYSNVPEQIFPGDADIVHGQYLFRPDSTDIDLYRFEVQDTGLLTIETIAERRADSSLLDSALVLYRTDESGTPQLIARNDDYFSEDSLIKMPLLPGVYYVGVSASGNDHFDPTIKDTGIGGTSEGPYDLRFDFRPDVDRTIVDATGTALDGDANGVPGGVYNFWFRAVAPTDTVFVDKAHQQQAGPAGSIDNPYTHLDDAFAAAQPGSIVRVVGNGGADDQLATTDDNLAYEIGIGDFGPLADGGSARVPRGVTVMMDAGAIFKLRQTAIQVGSSSVAIDRSGGAIQVLGTPKLGVLFTSYDDQSIGIDTNPIETTPDAGDWGGLLIRNDMDRAEGRFDFEQQGIFLNYVNHADIRYGGGNVTLNSVQQVINPIHLIDARPTLTFNTITLSADAGISANPDSFEETNFNARDSLGVDYQAEPFTADYDRVGPEIHGNRLVNNTTNGLFIRTATPIGNQLEKLTVSGRWDDTDIVHVLAENLIIDGTPGGPIEDPQSGLLTARTDPQLNVDPGITVKLDGARIEATIGTQLIAEGVDGRRVVFTSIRDDRFGAGGTFNTKGAVDQGPPSAGDWSGLYVGPRASLSLDFALLAYGGGLSRVEGSFAGFNAIELHQATARITNSTLEANANGQGGQANAERAGRGRNSAGAIFVLGAQPVLVGNVIRDTSGPAAAAITINANALNFQLLTDLGRLTGPANRITEFRKNQGPLIRDNRLDGNRINGLVVRGATLTTESVWDDTDIVHVLFDEIVVPDFHTFGGLRLESSPTESLVVKLYGPNAGFRTTGRPLDISDRIGGMLHVMGQPGHPVVLTSLADDSVGAGFDTQGQPQNNTDGGGRPLPTQPANSFHIDINFSPVAAANPKVVEAVNRAARMWERLFEDPITVTIDFDVADLPDGTAVVSTPDMVNFGYSQVRSALVNDARPHEAFVDGLPLTSELNVTLPDEPSNPFTVATQMSITHANALALGLQPTGLVSEYDPEETRSAKITLAQDPIVTTNSARPILFDYDRSDLIQPGRFDATGAVLQAIGKALGFTSAVDTVDAALADPALPREIPLNTLDLFRLEPGAGQADFTAAPRAVDPNITRQVFYDGGQFDPSRLGIPGLTVGDIPLSTGVQFGDGEVAGAWKDDALLGGNYLGIMDPRFVLSAERPITEVDRQAFDLIGYDAVGGGVAGDWQGITLEEYTHDRNVAVFNERELQDVTGPGTNATPDQAEFLGHLAPNEKAGDDTQRLGFDVQGLLNDPADMDVYSFRAIPGTEVWLDIDRTTSTLDTVVELVDADGFVLARSDNSYAEGQGLADTLYGAPGITVNGLQKSIFRAKDFWTTNPRDAGLRVVLPGTSANAATYHVRVRSSGPDLDNLGGGLTAGVYQLQIRLHDTDELPGTSIEYADIRYATDGIRVRGGPIHSPLLGEVREDGSANDRLPIATMPEWTFFSSLRGTGDEDQGETPDSQGWQYRNMIRSYFPDDANPYELAFDDPQQLGNILATDRATISLGGTLDAGSLESFGPDVDWYYFQVLPQDLGQNNPYAPNEAVELSFDLDYADGLGRADTSLYIFQPHFAFGDPLIDPPRGWVFDSTVPGYADVEDDVYFDFRDPGPGLTQDPAELLGATLMYASTNALDVDDIPAPLAGADLEDLSRGTVGTGDPLLGPVALLPGTYLMAVTAVGNVPADLDQYQLRVAQSDFFGRENPESVGYFPAADFGTKLGELPPRQPNNPFIRLEPINSIRRIAEDHIGEPILDPPGPTVYDPPVVPTLVDQSSVVPYNLGDVVLFVTRPTPSQKSTELWTVDPFTGAVETNVGTMFTEDEDGNQVSNFIIHDLAFRDDRQIFGLTQGGINAVDANSGGYVSIDAGDAHLTGQGDGGAITYTGIETYDPDPNDPTKAIRANDGNGFGVQFEAWDYGPDGLLYAVGNRLTANGIIENILYTIDANTGETFNGPQVPDRKEEELLFGAMTQKVEKGILDTAADASSPETNVLIVTKATKGDERLLTDGLTFTVSDTGTRTTYEFNSGPEVTFNIDLANGNFVRDGDTFLLDGNPYEFDTGAVLVVIAPDGNSVTDGSTFTITDNQLAPVSRTFEFDDGSGPPLGAGHVPVVFDNGMNQPQLVTAVVTAINSVGGFNVEATVVGNRITLTNDSTVHDPTADSNSGLSVQGAAGGTGTLIPVEENFDAADFAAAIQTTIDGVNTVPRASAAGNRMNFAGAFLGDFTDIEARGVFTDLGSNGFSDPANVPFSFLAADTAPDIAQRVADVINSQGTNATAADKLVTLDSGVQITNADSPLTIAGGAPGGTITGIAFVGTHLYAVSDHGGFFEIRRYATLNAYADYLETSADLAQKKIQLAGLTAGPENTEGGRYSDMLFAVSRVGAVYALDTAGQMQPLFADGKKVIKTGLGDANGLAFSPQDDNLWHMTTRRGGDAGHDGGMSFYFGDELHTSLFDPQPNNEDVPPVEVPAAIDQPGGTHGSLISNPFSLEGYDAADMPALYFNYFLATENLALDQGEQVPVFQGMTDSFRVFIADDSRQDGRGQWQLLATNNPAELTVDVDPTDDININVQQLFDNSWEDVPDPNDRLLRNGRRDPYTEARADAGIPDETNGIWRQAKISLDDFVGSTKLRLRFDFSTAGSMDVGNPMTGGVELQTIEGARLRDGDTFTIDGTTFEFDLGFTLLAPSGAAVADGETLTVDDGANPVVVFEFDRDGVVDPNHVAISVDDDQSATDVAGAVERAMTESGPAGIVPHIDGIRINLEGAVNLSQSAGAAIGVEGTPGTADTPILVHAGMNSTEVAEALIQPIADAFAGGRAEVIKHFDSSVQIIGHSVTDPGPLGLSSQLPGDEFGAFTSNRRGQNNAIVAYDFTDVDGYDDKVNFNVPIEGAYIDDLIIGFAGHGEKITDFRTMDPLSPIDNTFRNTAPGDHGYFVPEAVDFRYQPVLGATVEGEYQIEIRRASDYTQDQGPARSFDPRDRFAQAVTLTAPAGADAVDGHTFTLRDGLRSVTFEYDDLDLANGVVATNIPVPFRIGDTADQVAQQVELAINGHEVQDVRGLEIQAVWSTGSDRVDLAGENVEVVGQTVFEYNETGSRNHFRDQGQLLIANNQVSHSGMFGIVVEDGPRDLPSYVFEPQQPFSQFTQGDYISHPGAVRNLEELNDQDLAPGVTIINNVIAYGGEGGIHYSGDPDGYIIMPPLAGGYANPPKSEVWDPGGPDPWPSPFSFSVTDHNGLTVIFEFDNGDGVAPGNVPIVFTPNAGCPNIAGGGCMPRYHWDLRDMTDEMIQTINATDLDVTIYRGKSDELFLEGAADVRGVTPGPNPPTDWFEPWYAKAQQGMVPFGRIVNNTIVGLDGTLGETDNEQSVHGSDVGILIDDNASPTLLNNIVVNLDTGVAADDSARSAVLGANLFQGNRSDLRNVHGDDFSVTLAKTEPLFVDFEDGNFYLAEGTRAIDSAVDSLEERPALARVKEPVGIALSPIVAPDRDAIGQLRVDDPSVEPPDGFGENVFKDRGALDRADFTGPTAQLANPRDNDAAGNDLDPAENVVQLGNVALANFSIQLQDGGGQNATFDGTGIDPTTVSGAVVTLSRVAKASTDVITLQEGIDYSFSYDVTNSIIRLTPLAGVWATDSTYFITLDNSLATGVKDIAGNPLRLNQADGQTRFIVGLGNLEDFGDAPDPTYPTLVDSDGARHTIVPGFFLGALVDAELDGQPTPQADGDVPDEDGVQFDALLIVGSETTLTVTASANGMLDAWIDFNADGDWNDAGEQIFVSTPLSGGANVLNLAVPATAAQGTTFARFRFSSAGGLLPTGPAPDGEVEDYAVAIGTNPWQNSPNPLNVNNDAGDNVSSIDALVIINELNSSQFRDPADGSLPDTPPFPPGANGKAPFFYDVNGDGFATSIDALLVLNFLNAQAQGAVAAPATASSGTGVAVASAAVARDLVDGTVPVNAGPTNHVAVVGVANPPATLAASPPVSQRIVLAGDEVPGPTRDTLDTEGQASRTVATKDSPRRGTADATLRSADDPDRLERVAGTIDSLVADIAQQVDVARRSADPREAIFAELV